MTVWTDMTDAQFASDAAVDGLYKAGGAGAGTTVRVVPVKRDMDADLQGLAGRVDRMRLDVRASEVAAPAVGDTFTIGARTWKVIAPRTGDAYGLVWQLECAPA